MASWWTDLNSEANNLDHQKKLLGNKVRVGEAVKIINSHLSGDEIKHLEEPYLPRNVASYIIKSSHAGIM